MVKHHTQRFVEDGALFALVGLEHGLCVAVRAILRLVDAFPAGGCFIAATAVQSSPLPLAGLDGREQLAQVGVGDDAVIAEIQGVEEGLVEQAAGVVGGAGVQLVGILAGVEDAAQHGGTGGQFLPGLLEAPFDEVLASAQVGDALLEFATADRAIGQRVDQAVFLLGEFGVLAAQVAVEFAGGGLLVGQRRLERRLKLLVVVGVELERPVMVDDGFFDLLHRQMWQIALFELAATTEEVAVAVAVSVLGFGVDQTADTSGLVAVVATQAALEVVPQHALPRLHRRASVEHILDAVEQGLVDDGRVSPVVQLAVIVDVSGVVRIGQDAAQAVLGDRS